MSFVVVGIHTGIGKTLASAILCEKLGYDYWKPVQAGELENSDTIFVESHTANSSIIFHKEKYKLKTAASPHLAASIDNVNISLSDFVLPKSSNPILVETAGGILSPLNDTKTMVDLVEHLNLPVILVSMNYLGSINHTLLSYELLKSKNIPIIGLVLNGERNESTESYIENYTQLKILFRIPKFEKITKEVLIKFVSEMPSIL